MLTPPNAAAAVAFRKQTLLPLDKVLFAPSPQVLSLTRPSLHRLLEHHSISRLPRNDSVTDEYKRFNSYPIDFFHIDIAEVGGKDGKLFLHVAVDRTSKFAYAGLHAEATRPITVQMLSNVIETVPYRIHTALTDKGNQFPTSRARRPTARTALTVSRWTTPASDHLISPNVPGPPGRSSG